MNAPALVTLNLPPIGVYWPGEGGVLGAITGGKEGQPFCALIVPTDPIASIKAIKWGNYGDVSGAVSKLDGKSNTAALAFAGNELCQKIMGLEVEGHKDLYLMASGEGHALFANDLGIFETDDYFWTSTQYSGHLAWAQYFDDGDSSYVDKDLECRARAVRSRLLSN